MMTQGVSVTYDLLLELIFHGAAFPKLMDHMDTFPFMLHHNHQDDHFWINNTITSTQLEDTRSISNSVFKLFSH